MSPQPGDMVTFTDHAVGEAQVDQRRLGVIILGQLAAPGNMQAGGHVAIVTPKFLDHADQRAELIVAHSLIAQTSCKSYDLLLQEAFFGASFGAFL